MIVIGQNQLFHCRDGYRYHMLPSMCKQFWGGATRVQDFDPPTILTWTWKMNTLEGPKHAMFVLNKFESWIDSLGIILVSNQWLTGGLG